MLMKLCSHVNHDPNKRYLLPSRAYVEKIAADENSKGGGGRVGLFAKALQAAEAVTVVDNIVFHTCREAWHICHNENNTWEVI